jgi:enterochelin esterase-like enzyme
MRHALSPLVFAAFTLISAGAVLGACSSDDGGVHGATVPDRDAGAADGSPGPGEDAAVAADGGNLPDAAKPDCSRAAQTPGAPVSLYDAFVADMATLSDPSARAARAAKLVTDVTAAGGTPLESRGTGAAPGGDRVVFLAKGAPPNGTWNVGGSFRPGQPSWTANPLPLVQVAGTDLYVADTTIPRGTAHTYKLLSGTSDTGFREDPLASNVVWDGIDKKTVGNFNAVVHASDAPMTQGRLVARHGVHATALANDRDVFVYLPPRYDDGSCAALPHLVIHDGNESLTRGDFAGVADATFAKTPAASAILVFVALTTQTARMDEYTFGTPGALGDAYGKFLIDDLEPIVRTSYRVCSKAEDRGLSGASLGGLISTYLAFQRPDVWGYVGAQSASLFWDSDRMIARASEDPKVAVRFYLDHGCPNDNCVENQQMSAALTQKGYEVTHVEAAGAQHDWAYWKARLPQMLAAFRSGRPSTCQ